MPPGTITALRAQERDPQRVNVFIDGEFALGVSLTTITRAGLFVGKQLDAEAWAHLEKTEGIDRAMQAGLRLLESRPRSTAELRDRLHRKGYPAEIIELALAQLARVGLVDDASFARFWVENRQACRPRGAAALRDELRRKGIQRDLADQVVSQALAGTDPTEQALTLGRAALRRYASAPDRAGFERRMGGYLVRRGYSFEVVQHVLRILWAEVQPTGDDDCMS